MVRADGKRSSREGLFFCPDAFLPAICFPYGRQIGILADMKIDAQFYAERNALFRLDGTPVALADVPVADVAACLAGHAGAELLCGVRVPWSAVGLSEDSYDEAFLAAFRDFLKRLEAEKRFVVIVPVVDSPVEGDTGREALTAAFVHCARRVKDCASVVGFCIPAEVDAAAFWEALLRKHPHYLFFSTDSEVLVDQTVIQFSPK